MSVRTLANRLIAFTLMLWVSGPAPKAGSYEAEEKLTGEKGRKRR